MQDYRETGLSSKEKVLMGRLADSAQMSLDVMAHNYLAEGLSRDQIIRAIQNAMEAVEWDLNK